MINKHLLQRISVITIDFGLMTRQSMENIWNELPLLTSTYVGPNSSASIA